jgi:peptide-methionine (S)-S-oxide reductase
MTLETATLGGGCFWCMEAVFIEMQGVTGVVSGFAGGDGPHPTYAQVCDGNTGHVEVVQVTFDPDVITYRDLLDVFFTVHDPTSWDRQGADAGPQYRSVVFYRSDAQRADAERAIADLTSAGVFDRPVVTEVRPLDAFYPAEAYHQGYFARNAGQSYCRAVIAPKVAKLRQQHFARLRKG